MKKLIIGFALLVSLGACASPQYAPSIERVDNTRMNRGESVNTCTVQSAKVVQLNAPYGTSSGGSTSRTYNTYVAGSNSSNAGAAPGKQVGQIGGAVLGAVIGDKLIGGDAGKIIGGLAGMAAGQRAGENYDAKQPYSRGLQVIVRTNSTAYGSHAGNNLRMVVQGVSNQDHLLRAGTPCYFTGSGSNVRVLPM